MAGLVITWQRPIQAGAATGSGAVARIFRCFRTPATDASPSGDEGPWARKLVAAGQADGGTMTLEDLAAYNVIWQDALVAAVAPSGR